MPLIVGVALVLGLLSGGSSSGGPDGTGATPLPAVTASAPPHAAAQEANCTKLLAQLPVSLGKLPPRVVHTRPDSPFVVAWGNPAVVLSCAVARPAQLQPGLAAQLRPDGSTHPLYFLVDAHSDTSSVWYVIDRAPYVSISFPAASQPADYLQQLAKAVTTALPAVCSTNSAVADPAKLCTRRR